MITKYESLHVYHEHYVYNMAKQIIAINIFVSKIFREKFPIKTTQLPGINCNSTIEGKTTWTKLRRKQDWGVIVVLMWMSKLVTGNVKQTNSEADRNYFYHLAPLKRVPNMKAMRNFQRWPIVKDEKPVEWSFVWTLICFLHFIPFTTLSFDAFRVCVYSCTHVCTYTPLGKWEALWKCVPDKHIEEKSDSRSV